MSAILFLPAILSAASLVMARLLAIDAAGTISITTSYSHGFAVGDRISVMGRPAKIVGASATTLTLSYGLDWLAPFRRLRDAWRRFVDSLAPLEESSDCAMCEGAGWVQVYSPTPPAFDMCPECFNPDDNPCP